MSENATQVGKISQRTIDLLYLDIEPGTPIYLGKSNILHMSRTHPQDYKTYGKHILDILANPDYVGLNPKDDSIEYVKIFEMTNEFVKVAVRVSHAGVCYARTIYARDLTKLMKFVNKGHLQAY